MNYLSADRITIWYIRKRYCFACSVTSDCAICDPIIIRWLTAKKPNSRHYFTATQSILTRLQIRQQEVKKHAKLHLLHIYHIVIWSELKYLIAAKVLSWQKWGSAVYGTRPEKRRFRCSFGFKQLVIGQFGSLAVAEPNRGHGSSSNPDCSRVTRNRCWHYSQTVYLLNFRPGCCATINHFTALYLLSVWDLIAR